MKNFKLVLAASLLSILMSMTVFAGQWTQGTGAAGTETEPSAASVPNLSDQRQNSTAVPESSVTHQTTAAETKAAQTVSGISMSPYDGYTIVVNTGTKKYHVPSCKSVSQMKDKNKGYCSDESYLQSHGCSACKNCH